MAGTAAEVLRLDLGKPEVARLSDLGVRPGQVIHVVQSAAFGGRVVAVGADRIAIDGRTAKRIEVTTAPQESALLETAPTGTASADTAPTGVVPIDAAPQAKT